MRTLTGSTEEGQELAKREQVADAPFLSAGFWDEGTEIVFEVLSTHKSSNGPYIAARLMVPPTLELEGKLGDVEEHQTIRIGNLAGVGAARRAALKNERNKNFAVGDTVKLTCTGITPATKKGYSDSPNFAMEIQRPEESF